MDNLTLHQVRELMDYWVENPPLHLMVKAYLGIKPIKKKPTIPDENELQNIVQLFNRK